MKRIELKNLKEYIQDKGYIVEKYCYKCKKISYRNLEDAKVVSREMKINGKGYSYSYCCPKGNGFHLTSMKPKSMRCTKLKKQTKTQRFLHYCY